MPPKRKRVDDNDNDEKGVPESPKKAPKRAKVDAKTAEAPEEKRQARFRATCPQAIQERVTRVKAQR